MLPLRRCMLTKRGRPRNALIDHQHDMHTHLMCTDHHRRASGPSAEPAHPRMQAWPRSSRHLQPLRPALNARHHQPVALLAARPGRLLAAERQGRHLCCFGLEIWVSLHGAQQVQSACFALQVRQQRSSGWWWRPGCRPARPQKFVTALPWWSSPGARGHSRVGKLAPPSGSRRNDAVVACRAAPSRCHRACGHCRAGGSGGAEASARRPAQALPARNRGPARPPAPPPPRAPPARSACRAGCCAR